MKPLPFSLPALLRPQLSAEGEGEDLPWPLQRPDRLLFSLPEQEEEGTQQWVEQFKAIIGDAQGFVMADCGMPVPQQRAALLACQESPGKPAFVACLTLDEESHTPDGWDGDASLVLLQSMGCAAVLFTAGDKEVMEELPRLFSTLWEDARIPVGVILPKESDQQLVAAFPRSCLMMGPDESACIHLGELGEKTGFWKRELVIAAPPEEDWFIAVSNGRDHLLDPAFDIDGELECQGDFTQQLLDLESDGCTALRLLLPDEDAVDLFAAEQYMVKMPISLCAQDPVLLERALRAFWGRAVYDGTWPLEEEDLWPLVKKYGLILL